MRGGRVIWSVSVTIPRRRVPLAVGCAHVQFRQCSVIVQRVVMPVTESESWTVIGADGAPIEPVESFVTYLAALERSPNTQRAYATSLKLWFEFLDTVNVAGSELRVDDVA